MLPKHGSNKYQCPQCKTVASQEWLSASGASDFAIRIITALYFDYRMKISDYEQGVIKKFISEINNSFSSSFYRLFPTAFSVATCASCNEFTLWVDGRMVYPKVNLVPMPNKDLDPDIKMLYNEAASILLDSPKGSTALLRLALQKLLKQVGKDGSNINSDIKGLVAEGLNPVIQKSLDLLRVVGNNSVHPGQINLDDNENIALKLFEILNFIAEELITKPREIESLYAEIIPVSTQEHIKQRDGK